SEFSARRASEFFYPRVGFAVGGYWRTLSIHGTSLGQSSATHSRYGHRETRDERNHIQFVRIHKQWDHYRDWGYTSPAWRHRRREDQPSSDDGTNRLQDRNQDACPEQLPPLLKRS